MAENEVTLLLAAIACQRVHAVRCLVEEGTGKGMSLDRVRERVLKVAAAACRDQLLPAPRACEPGR